MPKALIFGSEGFVGPYLLRELESHGYTVAASDRLEKAEKSRCDHYYSLDLTDAEGVRKVICEARPDYVVNLAAISSVGLSWKAPQLTFQVNVVGVLNILEALRAERPKTRALLVGSGEGYAPSLKPHVETDPLDASSPYGISKATQDQLAEVYAKRYGLDVLRARPFNHTGVGQPETFVIPSWCKQAAEINQDRQKPVMKVGNVEVERDFSDVRDVVCAYRTILEKGISGEVYNVGSGECYPLSYILNKIITIADKKIDIKIDRDLIRPSDNPRSACNIEKTKKELGWVPKHNIEDVIELIYKSFI